jgi:hypothetical protein
MLWYLLVVGGEVLDVMKLRWIGMQLYLEWQLLFLTENTNRRKIQVKMLWNSLFALSFIAQHVRATHTLRFACSQLVTERLDPYVEPV